MKKKLVLALTLMAMCMAMMAGYASASGQETPAGNQNNENAGAVGELGLANPWTESDEQGVADATGFEMTAPEEATEVSYSYMKEAGLAQLSYVQDEQKWTYRMQATDELTDISGMSYKWTNEEEGTVAGMEAVYYAYVELEADDLADSLQAVQVVNWYDAVAGVTHSLSVSAKELDGLDIQAYAENLYAPLQGDATDDPEKDRETELKDYFLGEHKKSYDGSTLTIVDNNDGTFGINISIVRLCSLEDGIGTFEDHKMTFEVDDPNGNKMSGVIYRDSDNSLTLKITDSTWTNLPNDEVIDGFGK